MNPAVAKSYATVTEQPGQAASREQLAMMAARYSWARSYAMGKDVLEVACGAGTGLGMLAEVARTVEAGDIDPVNLEAARRTYSEASNLRIQKLDAMRLPYPEESFDLVLLFEAVYYLPDAAQFLREARRVLRPGGRLLIATVNCQWTGFNASPFHVKYLAAGELREALGRAGFEVELFAGFPENRGRLSAVRRVAVALHLVPRTMAGKALLKRIFYGKLHPIPASLHAGYTTDPLVEVRSSTDLSRYRVLYAAAVKGA